MTAGKRPETRIVLNTRLRKASKPDIRNSKELIKNVNGQVKIEQPSEEAEKRRRTTVTFRCKCDKTGTVLNPPLAEIRPPFQNVDGRGRIPRER